MNQIRFWSVCDMMCVSNMLSMLLHVNFTVNFTVNFIPGLAFERLLASSAQHSGPLQKCSHLSPSATFPLKKRKVNCQLCCFCNCRAWDAWSPSCLPASQGVHKSCPKALRNFGLVAGRDGTNPRLKENFLSHSTSIACSRPALQLLCWTSRLKQYSGPGACCVLCEKMKKLGNWQHVTNILKAVSVIDEIQSVKTKTC